MEGNKIETKTEATLLKISEGKKRAVPCSAAGLSLRHRLAASDSSAGVEDAIGHHGRRRGHWDSDSRDALPDSSGGSRNLLLWAFQLQTF